jgi:hypothetical protein
LLAHRGPATVDLPHPERPDDERGAEQQVGQRGAERKRAPWPAPRFEDRARESRGSRRPCPTGGRAVQPLGRGNGGDAPGDY